MRMRSAEMLKCGNAKNQMNPLFSAFPHFRISALLHFRTFAFPLFPLQSALGESGLKERLDLSSYVFVGVSYPRNVSLEVERSR